MFEWKVEEMELMNNHTDVHNGRYKRAVYSCESSVSREDKIAFSQTAYKCEDEERKYFHEHDEYSILKKRYREKNYDTTFGVHIQPFELKELLLKYEQLDALVEELTKETHIVY